MKLQQKDGQKGGKAPGHIGNALSMSLNSDHCIQDYSVSKSFALIHVHDQDPEKPE